MTIDSYISILSNENDTLDNEDRNQIIEWLKELKIYKESNISVKNYQQGRTDAFNEILNEMKKSAFASDKATFVKKYIEEQLKEQK